MNVMAAALFISIVSSASADETCFYPWTIASEDNGTTNCECGSNLNGVVKCDQNTYQLQILQSYCMTYSDALGTAVGHCTLTLLHMYTMLNTVNNVSSLNDAMCNSFNRIGQLCGGCKEGYAPPIYSYSLACVECSEYKYNWLKFITVALFPLTIFYVAVLSFRISALSANMDVFILFCQLFSAPGTMRLYGLYVPLIPSTLRRLVLLTVSLYGIWNLDFFRIMYTPFCLHPSLTSLQVLILDYAVAVYPLLLIFITYICVTLHDRYRIVGLLWGPLYRCLACIRREWFIRKSLIDVFASFLLLCYVKILNISTLLLTPTPLYSVYGQKLHNYVLYYDGTVEYLSRDHIPYALLAICMLSIFNVVPIILLCFYPCRCFQRCLNHCPCQLQALHTFMDAFHGSYKASPYDFRYFAGVHLLLRVLNLVAQAVLQSSLYFSLISVVFSVTSLVICFVKPRKHYRHNLVDSLLFAVVSIGTIMLFTNLASAHIDPILSLQGSSAMIFPCLIGSLPALYWMVLMFYCITPKSVLKIWRKRCPIQCWKGCREEMMWSEERDENTPLLTSY